MQRLSEVVKEPSRGVLNLNEDILLVISKNKSSVAGQLETQENKESKENK